MSDTYLVDPDIGFINEVVAQGGGDVKKCYQCATCSVACGISPDTKPFPRKEMIAASWGLKDKLIADGDIWLCHNCGDCTTRCPRGAKPGDVLAAIRAVAISEYAPLKTLGKWVNEPGKLPILLGIPAVLIVVIGLLANLVGLHWFDPSPTGEIAHHKFVYTTLVDVVMIPAFFFAIGVFAVGLKRFVTDLHANALAEGKTDKLTVEPAEFVKALVRVVPKILSHRQFNECGENRDRATAHMMVLFGFIGLFIVTNIFFVALYGLQIHGPYSQLNPVKWLANAAGIALVIGSLLMIKSRLSKKDQVSTYKDWYLVGLAFALGVSGMLTEMTRLAGAGTISYWIYFIHLLFVFALFAYTPYSKLAHLVYRTTAMAYDEYSGRK